MQYSGSQSYFQLRPMSLINFCDPTFCNKHTNYIYYARKSRFFYLSILCTNESCRRCREFDSQVRKEKKRNILLKKIVHKLEKKMIFSS